MDSFHIPFESLNGEFLKLIHGMQSIVFQIVSAVNIKRSLPTLSKTLVEGTDPHRFYCKLSSSSHPLNEIDIGL